MFRKFIRMKTKFFLFALLSITFIGCQRPSTKDMQRVDEYIDSAKNYSLRDITICEEYADSALTLSKSINYKKGIANALNRYGSIYLQEQDYPKALECYTKAVNISDSIGFSEGILAAQGSIGAIYMRHNDYGMAVQYTRNALKSKDENSHNTFLMNLIECFVELYKMDTTSTHFLDSAYYRAKEFDINMRNYSNPRLNGMPNLMFGIISFYENDKLRAWNHFEEAEKIFIKNENIYGLGWNNIYKAKILREKGDTNECIFLLYAALSQGEKIGSDIVSVSSKLLSEEYEKINIDSAYKYLKKHVVIQDNINESRTRIVLNEVQRVKSGLDKDEERRRHIIRLAWIGIAFCLFFVFIFLIIKFFSDILPMIKKYNGYPFIQRITKWGKIVLK